MGFGTSIFLIAVGAILAFAVNATVQGLDVVVVGWILMGVGALGLLISIALWDTWGFGTRSRTTVVERDREIV